MSPALTIFDEAVLTDTDELARDVVVHTQRERRAGVDGAAVDDLLTETALEAVRADTSYCPCRPVDTLGTVLTRVAETGVWGGGGGGGGGEERLKCCSDGGGGGGGD